MTWTDWVLLSFVVVGIGLTVASVILFAVVVLREEKRRIKPKRSNTDEVEA